MTRFLCMVVEGEIDIPKRGRENGKGSRSSRKGKERVVSLAQAGWDLTKSEEKRGGREASPMDLKLKNLQM